MKYKIAFATGRATPVYDGRGKLLSPPGFDVVEEFEAENNESANRYAEGNFSNQDWYVLDEKFENINAQKEREMNPLKQAIKQATPDLGKCRHCGADRDGIRSMLMSTPHDRLLARALLNECPACREAVGLVCEYCGTATDVHWYYIGGRGHVAVCGICWK